MLYYLLNINIYTYGYALRIRGGEGFWLVDHPPIMFVLKTKFLREISLRGSGDEGPIQLQGCIFCKIDPAEGGRGLGKKIKICCWAKKKLKY